MKTLKFRALALILALIMAVSAMGSVTAFADDENSPIEDIEVSAEYLGETPYETGPVETPVEADSTDGNTETTSVEDTPEPDWKPFQPTNSYVLAFNERYAYFSPFVPLLTYDNTEVDGYSILFGLTNTYTGETSEIAYCTDMPVDAKVANYQRLNLTDSTYAATHANKLRAIVLGSYPFLDLETLAVNSGIEGLTVCEAITGTQLAIWKTAHDDIVQIKDFLYTADAGYNSYYSEPITTERSNYINGTDEYKAAVKGRIEALYNYLMTLPEVGATSTVISAASFTGRSTPTRTQNADGTYNISVTTTVSIPSGSNVTLTAHTYDRYYYNQVSSVTSGSYTLTIENVPAKYAFDTVYLSLDGIQTASGDVFMLDAEGIRGVSQTMIAPLSGTTPVHAEVKAEPDRELIIYKTAGGSPLANISFEVYYVGSLEDYLSGELGIGTKPTDSDIAKYAVTTKLVGTITTDSGGYGSLNFSTDDGVYLVKELPNPLVRDSVAFFLTLPDYSRGDGDGNPAYTITAQPKNTVVDEKVEIEKDVTDINNEHDTYDVGENHTWIIQSSIPTGMASADSYAVSDTLDSRLTLVSVDKVAMASDKGTFGDSEAPSYSKDATETAKDEETLVLTKYTDYTVTTNQTEDGRDYFEVSLTPSGMVKAANAEGCNELRIYFTAYINTNAAMGENIPNQAHVNYVNNIGREYSADSDTPEVHTGGAKLVKVASGTETGLAGAKFAVYRMATPEEVAAKKWDDMIKIGETEHEMVKMSFHATADMSGEKVTELTTGEDGVGYIYGLAYGEYYLVETQAPNGYTKLREPKSFTIDANSHTDTGKITVENTSGTELPETGGIGTGIFTVTGLTLLLAAALLRAKKYKQA